MKKIRIFAIFLMLMLSFSLFGCDVFTDLISSGDLGDMDLGDDSESDDTLGDVLGDHVCDYKLQSTQDASCTKQGKKIYRCSCGKTKEEIIPATHTIASREEDPATCTEVGHTACTYCTVCKVVIEGYEEIPATGHTAVIDPATEATDTTPAKTEGKHCSVCGYVILKQEFVFSNEYSTPDSYDGTYAYEAISKLNNGEKLTTIYNLIDEKADYFHSSDVSAGKDGLVATIDFSSLGITVDEAIAAWAAYRIDHPLYYWMSTEITYTVEALNIYAYEEYSDSSVRVAYNTKIYETVEYFVNEAVSNSAYNTALAFHDLIIDAVDYAYEADGITPSDEIWAHSILGVFDTGLGVCESYAKSFQLLLNFCDIDNIFVTGYAGEAHAWNMLKLDDGNWYWCDLTWDDTPDFMWGVSYRYFCVTDTENVGWCDGPWLTDSQTFISSHTPHTKQDTGIGFNYDIPARSNTEFGSSDIILRDTFTVSDLTYAVSGYNSVQLVKIEGGENIVIPDTVEYNGVTFNVISIGIMEDGLFNIGKIAEESVPVKSVTIPASVIFIWDNAFNMESLERIEVDSDNPAFASRDGVLFTKDYSVLIKYPSGNNAVSYTVPDEVVEIAAGAFRMYYINLDLALESITLGENTASAGITNYGYGYEDTENGNFSEGEWDSIRSYLSGDAVIYDADGNVFSE